MLADQGYSFATDMLILVVLLAALAGAGGAYLLVTSGRAWKRSRR
jgi:hypothetical protein